MKPNPINRGGNKNALCPHYTGCLDLAVRRHWRSWDCSECTHKSEQEFLRYGVNPIDCTKCDRVLDRITA